MTRRSLLLAASGLSAADAPPYTEHKDLLYFLDARGDRRPVRTPADWARRVAHLHGHMQRVMGALPAKTRAPVDLQVKEDVRLQKYTRRRVTFVSEPGDRTPAFLLLPHDTRTRRPAMVCLPGSSKPGKDVPAGIVTTRPNQLWAHELAERGYVCLVIDYPMLHTQEYATDPYKLGYVSCTMKGIVNHRRGVDTLASLPDVDPRRIGVIGHSLGGHNALFLATFDPRVRVIVSSCGFNVFAKHAKGDLTAWATRYYMPRIDTDYAKDPARLPFDFTEILASLAPRPVFVNAPLHDGPDFEVSGVRDCYDAALPIYREVFRAAGRLRVEYPDAGHDFPPDTRKSCYGFLDDHLRS
ncbi:MAG: alpha/beta fold hydrolase [Acidobacteria bacterium]|nr:alpha/beta fold hydrolase [Acidobacteriota bacterium]